MIVVDASIAAKWVVAEADSDEALKILSLNTELIAPDLICAELTNIFHKKIILGEMTIKQATMGIQSVIRTLRFIRNSADLCADALQFAQRLRHSAYDCIYLALALSSGVLVTADDTFLEKCRTLGLGLFVARPSELTNLDGRSHPRISISPKMFEDIARLSTSVDETLKTLVALARDKSDDSRFQFIDVALVSPAFEAPAYRRLGELLKSLDAEQLAFLLALGWLGRPYNHTDDWPSLIDNAQHLAREGFDKHRSYFMAQMNNVGLGLRKLPEK